MGKFIIGGSRMVLGHDLWASRFPAALGMLAVGLLLWWWLGRVGPRFAGPVAAALWWTLPGLASYPETDDANVWMVRSALLDPLAAVFALVAGWWWLRSGRLRAAAVCGALAGLAVATKLPASLVVVVPAVAGSVAALARPVGVVGRHQARRLHLGVRLGRAVGHGLVRTGSGAVVFVAGYLPMGRGAVSTFMTGWRFQREHGSFGHATLVAGEVTGRPPWWAFGWWQYAAVGTAAAVALALCTIAAVAGRPLLGANLAAAWVSPVLLLLPVGHVALPAYMALWRPELMAAVAVGATGALGWAWVRLPRVATVAAAVTVAAVVAVPAVGAVAGVARLAPADYGALPGLVPPHGTVWLIGHPASAWAYLAPDQIVERRQGMPAAVAVDRAVAVRYGDRGGPRWAQEHGYRLVRSGSLDIWLRPPAAAR